MYSNNHHAQDDLKEGILYVVFSVMPRELECAMNNLLLELFFLFNCELMETISSTFFEYDEKNFY
jgi:hypothetical protein